MENPYRLFNQLLTIVVVATIIIVLGFLTYLAYSLFGWSTKSIIYTGGITAFMILLIILTIYYRKISFRIGGRLFLRDKSKPPLYWSPKGIYPNFKNQPEFISWNEIIDASISFTGFSSWITVTLKSGEKIRISIDPERIPQLKTELKKQGKMQN